MTIREATDSFETWLGGEIKIVAEDLDFKHQQMRLSPFAFFRATFYRWMQYLPEFGGLSAAPELLSVGDLHVENFGTWIDQEGRLIWGVNDFDEATSLPYTHDLIHLGVSVELARRENTLRIDLKEACEAILFGYRSNLCDESKNGDPFVLGEQHVRLRKTATGDIRNPVMFWKKMIALPSAREQDPVVQAAFKDALPDPSCSYDLRTRRAGLGSLGRQRFVALADWRGGKIAREMKTMAPSAAQWARQDPRPFQILVPTIIEKAVRCPDPCISFQASWQIRRLAPYCTRIELSDLPKERDEIRLLQAMGWETANIHRGSPDRLPAIVQNLSEQPKSWLRKTAKTGADLCERDFDDYRRK